MKRMISLLLAVLLSLSCAACGGSGADSQEQAQPAEKAEAESPKAAKDAPVYVPGILLETDFGSVTVVDAAFCARAQIYYTMSTTTRKSTINGKTTESYSETIHPGYMNTRENKMVFALKTLMTNSTSEDIEIHKMPALATFGKDSPVYFTKGGNYNISDEAYSILGAGETAEIILAALLPVDQFHAVSECLLELGGTKLKFTYDNISIYNAMGFQEGDNAAATIEEVITAVATGNAPAAEATEEETEPTELEPEIEMTPGHYKKDGSAGVEGRAIQVQDVAIGFTDTLPYAITSCSSYSYNADRYALNDSQVYAVIRFNLTNLTGEDMKLVDIKKKFMMQLTYAEKYKYTTNSDIPAFMTMGDQYGMISDGSSFNSPGGMTLAPLVSADVTAYIPCAKKVAENTDKSLTVSFISKHAGNESFVFVLR